MKTIKNDLKTPQSLPVTKPQSTKIQSLTDHKITQVFDRSVPNYENPKEIEHFWSQLNQDSKITSKTRDQRKLSSINKLVINKARALGIPAQQIRDVYFQRYRSPSTYITALRNYIPKLESELALLSSSEQVDSRLRLRIAAESA